MSKPATPTTNLTYAETSFSLQRAREHEQRNLNDRQQELADARRRVANLQCQVDNVTRAIKEIDEKLATFSDKDRIAALEIEVTRLNEELERRVSTSNITYTYTPGVSPVTYTYDKRSIFNPLDV